MNSLAEGLYHRSFAPQTMSRVRERESLPPSDYDLLAGSKGEAVHFSPEVTTALNWKESLSKSAIGNRKGPPLQFLH